MYFQAQLVHLLTEKELMAAKATFTLLDVDGDGRIKEYEALKSYKQWFKHFEKRRKRYIYPNIIVINIYVYTLGYL